MFVGWGFGVLFFLAGSCSFPAPREDNVERSPFKARVGLQSAAAVFLGVYLGLCSELGSSGVVNCLK